MLYSTADIGRTTVICTLTMSVSNGSQVPVAEASTLLIPKGAIPGEKEQKSV